MRKKDPMMKCTFLFTADILVFINDFEFIRNFLQDRKGLSVYLLLILPFLIIFDLMNVSIQYLDDMMVSVQLNINSPYRGFSYQKFKSYLSHFFIKESYDRGFILFMLVSPLYDMTEAQ